MDTDAYPAERLPRRRDLPHRRAAAGGAQELRQSPRAADGPGRRVLHPHPARRGKLLRSGRQLLLGGQQQPRILRLPRLHRQRRELDRLANDPYTEGVEGCDSGEHPSESPAEGTIQGGLSHEHNESITDPELDAWFDAKGNEIGDKCRTFVPATEYGPPLGTAPDGAPYNQVVDGGLYLYQQEFNNETLECAQRLAPAAPTVSKLSPKSGPAAGGTTVTITGTGFTGVSAVHSARSQRPK